MLAHPGARIKDLAAAFNKQPAWMGHILASDSFRKRLEERRAEFHDALHEQVLLKAYDVADKTLNVISQKLDSKGPEISLPALVELNDSIFEKLGYSGKKRGQQAASNMGAAPVNVQVVVPISSSELEDARAKLRAVESFPALTYTKKVGNGPD